MRRWELLQSLIDRGRFKSYLEIGAQRGRTFNALTVEHKVGVDIAFGAATYRGTSDSFFEKNTEHFDLVFIDGLHLAWQVLRDVDNALLCLNPGGLLVLHDCNPGAEQRQVVPSTGVGGWNGDVWKAFVHLRQFPLLDAACGNFDQGCGVVIPRQNSEQLVLPASYERLTYAALDANRAHWLRLMNYDGLMAWIWRNQ